MAEVEGSAGLRNDLGVRLFEVRERSREEYGRASPDARAICDAFAAGLNYYLARHPETKPVLITRFEPWHILVWQRSGGGGFGGVTPADVQREFPGLSAPEPSPGDLDEGSNM